jgi:dihydroxyacid dehydratase/phosphogluconate dehydratase
MAIIAEVLGMSLPGTAAIPAVAADRLVAAEQSGAAVVGLVTNPVRPSEIITEKSVENALRVLLAVSGSTNAVVHLAAVRTGDRIRLSVREKRIELLVDDAEIAHRLADHSPPALPPRGYTGLYARTVTQAPEGCDFAFLEHERTARWAGIKEN